MNAANQLEVDRRIAAENGFTFSVSVQEDSCKPWQDQATGLEDLKDAFVLVNHLHDAKIAIFVHKDGLGYMYWSSDHPQTLGSDLLS